MGKQLWPYQVPIVRTQIFTSYRTLRFLFDLDSTLGCDLCLPSSPLVDKTLCYA